MEESLSKFITAILAIIIMFIFPVYIAYEKKDDISYALAVRYTQDFVDKVRSKGYLTQELYQEYVTHLMATGNTYSVDLEHKHVRFDPSNTDVGQASAAVRSEEIYSTEHILNFMEKNEEHKYVMNVGDNFNVKIKNTNVTTATVIYNIVTVNMSSNNVRIHVDYGGRILADKWWGKINFFPGEEDKDYALDFENIITIKAFKTLEDARSNINSINNDDVLHMDKDSIDIYYRIEYTSTKPQNIVFRSNNKNIYPSLVEENDSDKYIIYKVTYGRNGSDIADSSNVKISIDGNEVDGEDVPKFDLDNNGIEKADPDVPIPDGFYYVGGSKETGMVISDNPSDEKKGVNYTCVGNQFVWIPVEDYSKFRRGTVEEIASGSGIIRKMTGPISSYFSESSVGPMPESVEKNKGFYIARFEAGDGDATSQRTNATTAHTVVSKKNAYIYNYVPFEGITGALGLSRNMYKGSNSVVSTLCYGVQWDAVMNFVSDAEHNIANSASWGNYGNSTGDAATNSGRLNMNYTTGRNEAWKAKNIYDLAGNVSEWTMESYYEWSNKSNYPTRYYVLRGGGYYDHGFSYYAGFRICGSNYPKDITNDNIGFRVALYLK